MEKRIVTVGLVQMGMSKDPKDNLDRALKGIADAAKKGAQIVALPELFTSPYFCQRADDRTAFDQAEIIPVVSRGFKPPANSTIAALSEAAKKHKIVLVGGSIFEKSAEGKYFNTTPMFGPDGSMLGTYRKTHIPEDILYHEQHYFSPGDTGVRVFDTPFGKIAPLICYDQWYPEAARIATLQGAEIIFYPTAIGVIDEKVEENITGDWETMWRTTQLGHAAANNVYICAINRVGKEDAITFWGGSFVGDPSGAVLAKAGDQEQVIIQTIDLSRVKALQKTWRFLDNRRPEMYDELSRGTIGSLNQDR